MIQITMFKNHLIQIVSRQLHPGSFALLLILFALPPESTAKRNENPDRQKYTVQVDKNGIMRRSDTKEEVSYYGTNYTTPFAYSYRALGYLDKDRKKAIDRDVYHISRLGLNAFRLHLWDAELADSAGNLLANDHLDLLDYMIAEFEKRGIDVLLTAQTNFGNGYPEKNTDTGAFTYDFDKCRIHDDPKAQEIQQRYLSQLARHFNPYTGLSYARDRAIIGMEINNEPCHSGTKEEVTAYIEKMAKALRKSGWDKLIFYNVTHNPDVTEAYYDAKGIDGTTYQWYPTGLVSNHERKGNFLPMLDNYTIPWKETMPNYGRLARAVYEFDPADVLYSYLYPAVARTFRKEGFQWITQFAYDPIEIAQYNTEYPTHYLNLAYTPAKALSMMIAAEVAKETPRGKDYGTYPENTKFGHTRLSYEKDLSEFNSPEKFIYTNNTATRPEKESELRLVAGHGSSPLVGYTGSGAYFLDRIGEGPMWRLEVLPDVTVISDPFGDTSLNDTKIATSVNPQVMTVSLRTLGKDFSIAGINEGNNFRGKASEGKFTVTPGTYLLSPSGSVVPSADELDGVKVAGNIRAREYVAPESPRTPLTLLSAVQNGSRPDVNAIPEAWDFRLDFGKGSWDEPSYYAIESTPAEEGILVVRNYVGDRVSRLPKGLADTQKDIYVKILSESGDRKSDPLPEGTEVALVTRNGATYSAPVTTDAEGIARIPLSSLRQRAGIIMPAPYPVMMTREIPVDPAAGELMPATSEIEFTELIIPRGQGEKKTWLLERIWIE